VVEVSAQNMESAIKKVKNSCKNKKDVVFVELSGNCKKE